MWILNFLPDWIFHLVVIIGLLGLLLTEFFQFMPFVSSYVTPLRILSIILLVLGVWFEGGISNNNSWLEKVHALEQKVAEAEVKSAQANTKLVTQISQKNKQIAKIQSSVKTKIVEITKVIDAECKIPDTVIDVLNEAARGPKGGKK